MGDEAASLVVIPGLVGHLVGGGAGAEQVVGPRIETGILPISSYKYS